MNAIQYRAKLKDYGCKVESEWIYWDSFGILNQWIPTPPHGYGSTKNIQTLTTEHYESYPELDYIERDTFGKCTGIIDYYANYIFSNDFIKINDEAFLVSYVEKFAMFTLTNICNLDKYGDFDYDYTFKDMHAYKIEIVGNRHDNPVLLTKMPTKENK